VAQAQSPAKALDLRHHGRDGAATRFACAKDARVLNSAPPTEVATFRAAFYGCKVELQLGLKAGCVYWVPDPAELPTELQQRLLRQFRSWRNACLKEFAKAHRLTLRMTPGKPDVVKLCMPGCSAEAVKVQGGYSIRRGHSSAPGAGDRG
jgi:hypothetical protein